MPTNRTRRKRSARYGTLPPAVQIWLEIGDYDECQRVLDERHPEDARLGSGIYFFILHYCYDDPFVADDTITRADLRKMGYGPQIDAHIEAGLIPPDAAINQASPG